MLGRDVVYELLYEHRLAHACAAEEAGLTALGVRLEQVDDLDARFEDIDDGALLGEIGRGTEYAHALGVRGELAQPVYRLAQDVEHPAQGLLAHGDGNAAARGDDLGAAHQPLRFREHDATHRVVTDMVSDFHILRAAVQRDGERLAERGQLAALERHVHDGSGNLYYLSFVHQSVSFPFLVFCARAPALISVISCVIADCLMRL